MRTFFIFITCISLFTLNANETTKKPSDAFGMHICAFHIAKDDPKVVVETQHYCTALRDNLFQCLLFETVPEGKKPKLLGVEYVISDELYQKLSSEEKRLWHPHDYEVHEGLLALIGTSKQEEQNTMKLLVKTWGKIWHTWPDPTTDIPLGSPRLMWSAVKEGQVPQNMIKQRDQRFGIDTSKLKKEREQYLPR